MGDVKIPISASVKGVTDELNAVEKKLREVAKAAEALGRIKFKPIDANALGEELKKLERMMLDTHRRVQQGTSGGAPGAPTVLPPAPSRPAPSGFYPAAPGGQRQPPARRGPGAYTHAPGFGTIPQQFVSGVGGGFSTIASYGARGAVAGAYGGGGLPGGLMGLAGGLGIGALAFGAFKVGQGVSEGYDLAKDRAGTLDTLKRQLGDVGVSFQNLKVIAEEAAQGLQLNSKEAAELALQFNRLSRGHGGQAGLADGVRTSVGVSRAYGLDPAAGVGFFGGMANMDRRQNNRELALLLAETIQRSGMSARADEVMQALQGYASTVSRMVLGTGGLAHYAGAYGSLMGMQGMTSETATSLLGAANASVMRGGAFGEASKNFQFMALQRYGGALNPYQAMALSEGGLFGTRGSVFGSGVLRDFVGAAGMPGGNPNVTNFQALRAAILNSGADPWTQLDMAKNHFGVGSFTQAAALMQLDDKSSGTLMRRLQAAGVDISKVNASGIQALTKGALGGASDEELRKLASSNREETEFTRMQDSLKALDDIKINTGDKLIGPINTMRDALVAIAGKLAPDSPFLRAGSIKKATEEAGAALDKFDAETASMKPPPGTPPAVVKQTMESRARMRQQMVAAMTRSFAGVDPEILRTLAANEKELGLPAGTLMRQVAIESGFNPGAQSKDGAIGLAQILPTTATALSKRAGRTLDPNDVQDNLLMQKMLWQENLAATHGDLRAAAERYHGGTNPANYGPRTEAYADALSTPLPAEAARATTGDLARADRIAVEGTITLQDPRGNPIPADIQTRVSRPRGAGAQQ